MTSQRTVHHEVEQHSHRPHVHQFAMVTVPHEQFGGGVGGRPAEGCHDVIVATGERGAETEVAQLLDIHMFVLLVNYLIFILVNVILDI